MKSQIVSLAFFLTFILSACGGGSSSGGEQANKNVTFCIGTEEVQVGSVTIIRDGIRFTNNCGFVVNFATAFAGIIPESIIVLDVNEQLVADPTFFIEYIACRPPSVPVDLDSSSGLSLSCS